MKSNFCFTPANGQSSCFSAYGAEYREAIIPQEPVANWVKKYHAQDVEPIEMTSDLISKLSVNSFIPKIYSDKEFPSLMVELSNSGKKVFFVVVRDQSGRPSKKVLGLFPELSVDLARFAAHAAVVLSNKITVEASVAKELIERNHASSIRMERLIDIAAIRQSQNSLYPF